MAADVIEAPGNVSERSIVTSIREDLRPFKDSVGAGLFYLSIGKPLPDDPPQTPPPRCISTRFTLRGHALDYLAAMAKRFGSERAALSAALVWVAAQPDGIRSTFPSMFKD